jgi:hypothetical protein
MKFLLGIIMILAGIALGLYVGLWVMFVGGIVQGVNGVTADPVVATDIAWGIVRICFAGLIGWVTSLLLVIPGMVLTNKS